MSALRITNSVRALASSVLALLFVLATSVHVEAQRGGTQVGNSTREARDVATRAIPYNQLTSAAATKIQSIVENASYFRRLPTETLECDPEMFTFMVRNPEVMVGIWDVMGITRVTLERIGQYQLAGNDGAGTTCKMDLIFGNDNTHIYHVSGGYKGSLWPKELQGNSIILLHNHPASPSANSGGTSGSGFASNQIRVTMDVFLKLENIGADLVVRTLGPLVNKSADSNFVECVAFVEQISHVASTNPIGMQNLAGRLRTVDAKTRDQFVEMTRLVASKTRVSARSDASTVADDFGIEDALHSEMLNRSGVVAPPDAILTSTTTGGTSSGVPSSAARPYRGVATGNVGDNQSTSGEISSRKNQSRIAHDEVGDSPTLQLLNQLPLQD